MMVDLDILKEAAATLDTHDDRYMAKAVRVAAIEIERLRNQNVGGDEGLREALTQALARAAYAPGDHPIVPAKIARFLTEVRAIAAGEKCGVGCGSSGSTSEIAQSPQ